MAPAAMVLNAIHGFAARRPWRVIKEGAADYIKGLRKELDVQITDPALKQLDETVRAQADAAATTGLSSPAASAGAK